MHMRRPMVSGLLSCCCVALDEGVRGSRHPVEEMTT